MGTYVRKCLVTEKVGNPLKILLFLGGSKDARDTKIKTFDVLKLVQ